MSSIRANESKTDVNLHFYVQTLYRGYFLYIFDKGHNRILYFKLEKCGFTVIIASLLYILSHAIFLISKNSCCIRIERFSLQSVFLTALVGLPATTRSPPVRWFAGRKPPMCVEAF